MNSDLPTSSKTFGLYEKEKIIAFISVIHQPNKNKKIKRVCRLVVLPDYQGIGIGTKFLIKIAEYYNELGFDFSIVTSAKNLIKSLIKKKEFILINYSARSHGRSPQPFVSLEKAMRTNCKTASFFYRK